MDFFQNRYYRLNRWLLYAVGLWPYEHWRARLPKAALSLLITLVATIDLIMKLVMVKWTVTLITASLQLLIYGLINLFNLIYFICNSTKLKMTLDFIRDDWDLHEQWEMEVIKRHAESFRMKTLVTTILGMTVCLSQVIKLAMAPFGSKANGTGASGVSSAEKFPYLYNVEYHYYILSAAVLVVCVVGMTTIGVGCIYGSSVIHACGIFNVVGERLEVMFHGLKEDIFDYKVEDIRSNFVQIMVLHVRSIKYVDMINALYGPIYIVETSLTVGLISADIFLGYGHDRSMFISAAAHFFGTVMCIFVFSWIGQQVMDHSSDVFLKIYASQWYLAPVRMQKLLIVAMIRSQKGCDILITQSFTACFELFLAFMKVSMSIFMALNSYRNKV